MAIPRYEYYQNSYLGVSIPDDEWDRISKRAYAQIMYFERIYTVTGSDDSRDMAVCAVADEIYTVETISKQMLSVDENGDATTKSVSIGSVSTSTTTVSATSLGVDMTEKGQRKRYYDAMRLYLDVYRGFGKCRL